MRNYLVILLVLMAVNITGQQKMNFDFTGKPGKKAVSVTRQDIYTDEKGYGYDLIAPSDDENAPFFFSVKVPEGNYKIRIKLGSDASAGETTLRAESSRLYYENVKTGKGKSKEVCMIVNRRDTLISGDEYVKIKKRERNKRNWDNRLTIEINGRAPRIRTISIEKDETAPTIFLCGNSTVVDQDNLPYASWGQMITRFFNEKVCVANYAESGEAANTFIKARRLKKLLTQIKPGDYVFVEFGHNDQKQKKGSTAYTTFTESLRTFISEARQRGATPVFVTPTQRRSFNNEGKIEDTHKNFPKAMKDLARDSAVSVIDLHSMTRTLYEAMGEKGSCRAFVHYPANTFPNQSKALEDNTHFNPYGAYQIALCIATSLTEQKHPLARYIRKEFRSFDASQPLDFETFHWDASPFVEIEKPDGN